MGKNQSRVNAARRIEALMEQFPDGNIPKIVSFVFELFEVYVEKPSGGWGGTRTTDMLHWFDSILTQY